MTVTLPVPCFRYSGNDFAVNLGVEQGPGADLLVRCPVRCGLYVLTPEERVRQAFVRFLIEGAGNADGWRERLRFEVEQRSLDVAAFLAREGPDERCAFDIPVLIVETKRIERELTDDVDAEEQLKTYMLRERCGAGLIFNARQAAWLSRRGELAQSCWNKDHLSDLSEVEERLQGATADATAKAADCRNYFTLASAGDFDSLLRLVSLIGNDPRLTFMLSIRSRGNLSSVQAFGIRVLEADKVTYRARGIVSRNRQQLARLEFHSLLGVRPL